MTDSLEMDKKNKKVKEEESYFRTRVDCMTRIQPSFSVQYQNMQIPSFYIVTFLETEKNWKVNGIQDKIQNVLSDLTLFELYSEKLWILQKKNVLPTF